MNNLDRMLKSRDITLPTKIRLAKAMVFPVVMYGCESWTIERWAPNKWCFWNVVLDKTLESPLDCKESQPVHLKGNQSWILTGRTDAETETPILWPPDVKSWLTGRDPDAGKDWRQEEKGDDRRCNCWMCITNLMDMNLSKLWELVMDREAGVLQSMGCKESDMTEQLNWLVRYFVEYFNWYLYNVHLMINLELWVLWKKTTEIKFSPYSALSEMS